MLCTFTALSNMSDLRTKLALDVEFDYKPGPRISTTTWVPPISRHTLSVPTVSSPIYTISTAGRELPMPSVQDTFNLAQAQATLQLCYNKLRALFRSLSAVSGTSTDSLAILAEMRRFKYWLEQWERTFSMHLAAAVSTMSSEEVRNCRILKANHLACLVLASMPGSREGEFGADFRAIVGLAAAIIGMDRSVEAGGMGIGDPLRVAIECCQEAAVRTQAERLLQLVS